MSTTTFTPPTTLSPSRVEAFTSCPLAFRFASIDKLPEPPTLHTTRGSLVHRTLELAFLADPGSRTPDVFRVAFERALEEYRLHPDFVDLNLDAEQAAEFETECRNLVERYLSMEDPNRVRAIGLELRLEAKAGDLVLRGIIDRLELDDDGDLVVTDYKTGRSPSPTYEQRSLAGVHFYSFLCEAVLGRRPRTIRLMYLRTGEVIETTPSERSVRFITTRTKAVYEAVERACAAGDFRPRPSSLCGFCAFREWCPEFGGDPALAAVEAPARYRPHIAA
jgi:putative RecB family exonuclease